jgi:BirA family biotin operon repressor/biotin-[acetyl-CoA-carboxylase] ligase
VLLDAASTGVAPWAWPQLSLATAVTVCDALEMQLVNCRLRVDEHNPPSAIRNPKSSLGLKWPNDVLLTDRKVCGILIESRGGAVPAKERLIIGIGINVNNSSEAAPGDIRPSGIALCDFTGETHDLQAVIVAVLDALSVRIQQLQRRDRELIRDWQRLNALAGQRVTVHTSGRTLEGECEAIAEDGSLVINTPGGQQRIYSGSVRLA